VTDVARIISSRPDSSQEGTVAQGSGLRRGPSVSSTSTVLGAGGILIYQILDLSQILPEMSAIIRERDTLEAQKDRLRTILETSD
jgi:hypothetical protein